MGSPKGRQVKGGAVRKSGRPGVVADSDTSAVAFGWPYRSSVGVVLLLLSAVAVLPGAAEPYPLVKIALAGLGAALVLSGPRWWGLPRVISILLGAVMASLLLAAVLATNLISSVMGRYPRYEGLWVVIVYCGALVAGARIRVWKQATQTITRSLTVAALFVSLVATIQYFSSDGSARITSLLGNASELGVWAATVSVLMLPAATRGDRWAIVGASSAAVALVLSASRGALLAFLVGVVVVLVLSGRTRRSLWVLTAAAATFAVAFVVPLTRGRLLDGAGMAAETTFGRLWLWRDTLALVQQRPVFGVGPSGFVDAIGSAHGQGWASAVGPANPPDSPHNAILQIAAAGGIVTLGLVVALVGVWLVLAWRAVKARAQMASAAFAAVIVYAVGLATHFTSPATTPLAALLAGWVVAAPVVDRVDTRPKVLKIVQVSTMVVAAAVLALASASEWVVASAMRETALGRADAAQDRWDWASRLRPWDQDLILREAHANVVAVAAGTSPAAVCLSATKNAVNYFPTSSEAAIDRVRCLEAASDFAGAAESASVGLDSDPDNVELLLLAGVTSARAGDLEASKRFLARATELRPQDSGKIRERGDSNPPVKSLEPAGGAR